jgi:hypothetical protein
MRNALFHPEIHLASSTTNPQNQIVHANAHTIDNECAGDGEEAATEIAACACLSGRVNSSTIV